MSRFSAGALPSGGSLFRCLVKFEFEYLDMVSVWTLLFYRGLWSHDESSERSEKGQEDPPPQKFNH